MSLVKDFFNTLHAFCAQRTTGLLQSRDSGRARCGAPLSFMVCVPGSKPPANFLPSSRQPPRFVLLSLCILENVLGSHTGHGLLAALLALMSGSTAKNGKGGASLSRYLFWDVVHCVETAPVLKSEQFHRLPWNIQVAADALRKLCTGVHMR